MPTIGVFRAVAAAAETRQALQALGLSAALAPVIAPVALGAKPPPRGFACLVATSALAFDLSGGWLKARFAKTPLRLAGSRTLAAARAAGLLGEAAAFADAAALAQNLVEAPTGEALYLAGRDRKPVVEEAFAALGRRCETVETYEARARPSWDAAEVEALRNCVAFLHYSRRSAELTLALADASALTPIFAARPHLCLSEDVAAPLIRAGFSSAIAASAPDEPALLRALLSALGRS